MRDDNEEETMANAPKRAGTPPASTLDANAPVAINRDICNRLAEWLRSREIPLDREDSSLKDFSTEEVGNFYLLLVAISHQTTPRGGLPLEGNARRQHLRGWDYLFAKLEDAARQDSRFLSPDFWARITGKDLQAVFRDRQLGDRLSDSEGRASLVRDLGETMLAQSWKSAKQIYDAADGRIATGYPNLVGLLSQARAYRDPVRKKIYFFLALMQNSSLWVYVDADQLGAPVDYHEVRGHLRIGTVEIRDPNLYARLLQGSEVSAEEDVQIRQAVHGALMFLSQESGKRNPSQLHYLFWNVFRSCCTRERPHCFSCPPNCSLPARYVPFALFPDGSRHCPFSEICTSAGREPKLLEHNVVTDFY
jgi:hypothetical protein